MNNTIWDSVSKTDPKFTKNFKRGGGFGGTDINPAYRLKRMTEQFGICGVGWGWVTERVWREDYAGSAFVFAQVNVWTGDRVNLTGSQIGGTDASRTPDESYKMAITDALGKCFLALGVAADVYLGEFDSKYSRETATPQKQATQAPAQQAKPAPATPQKQAPAQPQETNHETVSNVPECPICTKEMYDNTGRKKTGWKGPAYKCKDKSCSGVIWQALPEPVKTTGKPSTDDIKIIKQICERLNDVTTQVAIDELRDYVMNQSEIVQREILPILSNMQQNSDMIPF
jgi:hypothetical protein